VIGTCIQVALIMLLLGHGRGAAHILLIGGAMLLISPWFWAALFGVAAATHEDDR
jgi:hypothetical protein